MEQQAGTPPAREALVPGSVPSPGTAEGESVDKDKAVREWVDRFELVSRTTGEQSMNPGSALAELTRAGSHLIAACKGEVSEMVRAIGPQVFNPFVDVHQVKFWFGGVKHFPRIDELCRMLEDGAPTDVRPKDLDDIELEYGNHQSATNHKKLIWEKATEDVRMGRAIPFEARRAPAIRRLRISPLGVVHGSKLRIIHDLSFSPARDRSSVNHLTEFEKAPRLGLGHVLPDILTRIMYLRQRFGQCAHIVLSKVDVKDAFRQIRVEPAGAPAFGYRVEDTVLVDLRLQFGWRSSPGFWGLAAAALEHSHNHTSFRGARPTASGVKAAAGVSIPERPAARATPLPTGCNQLPGTGGGPDDVFFVRYYVDDGVLVEVQWFRDGRRCRKATQSLASDHFRLLGERGPQAPPLLSPSKMSNWSTKLEVLGWWIDTTNLTIGLSEKKRVKLTRMIDEWPASRRHASVREIQKLTGLLLHVSFVIRPGLFFVHRLWRAAGMQDKGASPQSTEWETRPDAHKRVHLGPEFHADMEFWRCVSGLMADPDTPIITAPMHAILDRPPVRTMFSDASAVAVGGYSAETGKWWRYDLEAEQRARMRGSSAHSKDDLSINVLELLGMVVSAFNLVVTEEAAPATPRDPVLLRGDNQSAVHWINRCRGGKEPRSGALMRILGLLEIRGGWKFEAKHIPGALNQAADGISRWNRDEVQANLSAICPDIAWQELPLSAQGTALCSGILASDSSDTPLRRRLNGLTRGILDHGSGSDNV